jgi:hypothetical protein
MTRQRKRKATDAERQQLEHAILSAILTKGEAGTDVAHDLFERPDDVEPRTWGAIAGGLQAEGLIRRVGDSHTRRSVAHGRRIGQYAIEDAETVQQRCKRLEASAARKRAIQRKLPGMEAEQ